MDTIKIIERMKSEFHGLVIYAQRLACVPVVYEIQLPNATVIQAKTILEDTFDTSNMLVGKFLEIESLVHFIEFNHVTLIDLMFFDRYSNQCLAQLIEYEGKHISNG